MKKKTKNAFRYPEYAKMRHGDDILTLQIRHGSTCGQHAAVRFLSFPRAGTDMLDYNNPP